MDAITPTTQTGTTSIVTPSGTVRDFQLAGYNAAAIQRSSSEEEAEEFVSSH